jgi:predicted AAA+ superfamily ATPase
MEQLIELFRRLLLLTDTSYIRYLYDKIDWSARMIGIVGPRGVGKTTMLLQRIKLNHSLDDTLFINADDLYFAEHRLFDLASDFYKNGGRHLFIDEVHKYSEWSKELKMIYDYYPDFQIIFTGSSILDIYKGNADLSRRALSYYLPGLSFREYLNLSYGMQLPAYSLEDILSHKIEFPETRLPLPLFKEYMMKDIIHSFGILVMNNACGM